MDLFNSPSEPIRFQPRGDRGPTFFLRQALARDRVRLQVAVDAELPRVHFWDVMAALRSAIDRLEQSGQFQAPFPQWRELLDLYTAKVREAADYSLSENSPEAHQAFVAAYEAPQALKEVTEHTKRWDREFAKTKAEADNYSEAYGVEAARAFVVGWEGKGLGKFVRDATGASEQSLLKIQPIDMSAIGRKVQDLLEPKPDMVGNSDLESSTPPIPTPSSDGKTTPRKIRANGATSEATAAPA